MVAWQVREADDSDTAVTVIPPPRCAPPCFLPLSLFSLPQRPRIPLFLPEVVSVGRGSWARGDAGRLAVGTERMEAEAQSLTVFEVGRAPPPHHVGSSAPSSHPLRLVPGKTEVGCDGAG